MHPILAVGAGGFLGSILRYKIGGVVLHHALGERLPLATLAINVLGCLAAGALAGWAESRSLLPGGLSPTARLFLITGFCGGFTTFSAFGLETMHLVRRQAPALAGLNVALSLIGGLGGVWLGWRVATALARP
ncbi:MAG TPA: fluoride efflux transporter CrcB [Gemmatimonadales bacterium]|nr:fluoride efflux transporter CrcB [Gemmatimonadales bacterium]